MKLTPGGNLTTDSFIKKVKISLNSLTMSYFILYLSTAMLRFKGNLPLWSLLVSIF